MLFKGVSGLIRHLEREGFLPFGSVLQDTANLRAKPNHHSVLIPEGTVTEYCSVGSLWLGMESGLAILSVSIDGKQFDDFYLDKSIQLKSGICFRLTGLGGKASVQMSSVSMPRYLGQWVNERDFAVRPKVRVESLYTVFHQQKEAGFFFAGEAHPMAELLWVRKGQLHSVADGQQLLLEEGDAVLYAPEQWHMQYADSDQAPQMVTIGFWARGICWETLAGQRLRLDLRCTGLLEQILEAQKYGEDDRIFSLLTLLLLELQKKTDGNGVQTEVSGENAIIRRAQQYVQTGVTEKLTVPVVAQGVGVSASYLTALFHKHLAVSPGEYIRRIKLQQSKQLIREGKMNFTEISEMLQYSTVHHFSRQFKLMFGMTPTEYAKRVR